MEGFLERYVIFLREIGRYPRHYKKIVVQNYIIDDKDTFNIKSFFDWHGSSTKVVDVDAKVFDREECTSDNDFKRDMAFVLGAMSMLKLSRGVVHEATGMLIFEFNAVDTDKRGRQLKLEMYYEEY